MAGGVFGSGLHAKPQPVAQFLANACGVLLLQDMDDSMDWQDSALTANVLMTMSTHAAASYIPHRSGAKVRICTLWMS